MALGAQTMTLGGGERAGASLAEQLDLFCAFYPEVLRKILEATMTPALYATHCKSFFKSPEAFEQLWQRIPEPGVKFDPANWYAAGFDYLEVTHRLGPRLAYVHIKEFMQLAGTKMGEPAAGMGVIDWGKVIGLLDHHQYDGWLSIEPHGPYHPKTDKEQARRRVLVLSKRHVSQFVL